MYLSGAGRAQEEQLARSRGSLPAPVLGQATMDFTPAEEKRAEVPGEPLPAAAQGSPASLHGLRGGDGLQEQKLGLCCVPCSRAGKPALLQPQLCQLLQVPCSMGKVLQAHTAANAR